MRLLLWFVVSTTCAGQVFPARVASEDDLLPDAASRTSRPLAAEVRAIESYIGRTFVTPRNFGAVGDGAADDTAAMRAWLHALAAPGKAVAGYCPAGIYKITAPILLRLDTFDGVYFPGINILGDGGCVIQDSITAPDADAITIAENASNGLGHGGWGFEKVHIRGVQFWRDAALTQPTGALLKLWGVAGFTLDDIGCEGTNRFNTRSGNYATCIALPNSQQGRVTGGFENNCNVSCISSIATTAGGPIEIAGAALCAVDADGVYFQNNEPHVHGNQISGCDTNHQERGHGIHLKNIGGSGSGDAHSNHFETNAVDAYVEGGALLTFHANYSTGAASLYATGRLSRIIAYGNVLRGGTLEADSGPHQIFGNQVYLPIVDRTGCAGSQFANVLFSSGSVPCPTNFPDAAAFMSRAKTAGDIVTLNPSGHDGDWGMRVNGYGAGHAYVSLNGGPVMRGVNGDAETWEVAGSPGGTAWLRARPDGVAAVHVTSTAKPVGCTAPGGRCRVAENSTDTAMVIDVEEGSGGGPLFRVKLGRAYAHGVTASCMAGNAAAAGLRLFQDLGTAAADGFTIAAAGPASAGGALRFVCNVGGN